MSFQKRIALVSAFPPGPQTLNEYGMQLVKGFAARDDVGEIIVLADRAASPPIQELDLGAKVRVQRVWDFNHFGSQVRLLGAIRQAKADLVLFNLQTASFGDRALPAATGLCLPLMARLMGQTSGLILHDISADIDLEPPLRTGPPLRPFLMRMAGKVVTRALLGATYVTTTLPRYYDFLRSAAPRAHLAMVPHGTFEVGGDIHPPSQRPPCLNTMGTFGTYRRLETLISAFQRLRKQANFADLELEIGGKDHPNAPGYMAALKKTHADEPGIKFLADVGEEEVPDFFGRARISVFDYAAATGGSGWLHQAITHGTVPIFPDIDDFVDMARGQGLRGFHYAPNNVDSMVQALTTALRAGRELDEMSQSNLDAAGHMPFFKVIDHHMKTLGALSHERPQAKAVATADISNMPMPASETPYSLFHKTPQEI